MGAMQAMEWAALYPDMVESIIPISAPGRAYPQSIALRKSQRKAIMNDPDWQGGDYYGHSVPARGLELARFIGFITYRSEPEFAQRFGRDHRDDSIYDISARFEIESYLEHHGKKLATWFDANTYLYLSKAMDLHDMGRDRGSYEEGIQHIQSKVLVIGVDSDILFPCYQQKEFVDILGRTNPNVKYREMQSLYGHDAFLVEEAQVSRIIRDYVDAL
jgi:homoserine O-acetyltransferase